MRVRLRCLGIRVLAAGFIALIPAAASAADPQIHNVALRGARVSVVSPTRVVVSMEAQGDLRGELTLTLDAADGHLAGEWALVVRYLQDVDANGLPAIPDFDETNGEPKEHFVLVDKGTLSGAVTGGVLTLQDGTVTGVESIDLSVSSGSLTFDGVSGSAVGAASDLQDILASSGSLALTF